MARSATGDAITAFQRFGLGAKPGGRAMIAGDPRGAVLAELSLPDAALIREDGLKSGAESLVVNYTEQQQMRDQRERTAMPPPASDIGVMRMEMPAPAPAARGGMNRAVGEIRVAEGLARFRHGFVQPVGFVERLVMFWSNHFCVSLQKGAPLQATAGAFEREAIRPHVLGRFEAMLKAVEQHPAMLIYLDNRGSIGPGSRAGQSRKRGLNENLAREILELHTLGVNGGYTQQDVTSFARVLTGWTVVGPEGRMGPPGTFAFQTNAHEPGAQTVLGRAYPDSGVAQGEAILRDLAQHPSTARFIAGKFARHFVADDPPKALVARLEKSFLSSGGDLGALARTLIQSDEAWAAPASKLRTPYEFLSAAGRATGQVPLAGPQLFSPLAAMGQPLWAPSGPNGFSDSFETLAAPEALKTRLDVAATLGKRLGNLVQPAALAEDLYGEGLSVDTRQAILRAESRAQGLALLLMAPEFLRR